MKGDLISMFLDILEQVVTVIGWIAIVLGLFFFTMPEKGFF